VIIQIAAGVVLYVLAGTLTHWVLYQPPGSHSYYYSPDAIRQLEWSIRGFAALVVVGGYAERIRAALRSR
jgi:hypothetical protein